MLVVHHLGKSQSERVVWLMEELGLPYTLDRYDREASTGVAPPAYKALHPMGTAPVLSDDGSVIGESGAIVDYIAGKYGEGQLTVDPSQPAFADFVYWSHFGNGTMMPTEMILMVVGILGAPDSRRLAPLTARRDLAYAMIEKRLGEAKYFAGDTLTTADIMMVFPLTTMRYFVPFDLTPYPSILRYLGTIGDRPAYRRALSASDPGMVPLLS